jgi:uncharacterized protein (TIGR04255 family)
MTDKILPDFEKPPVAEVVSGIQFKSIKNLTGPNLNLLADKFRTEYPVVKEVLPLAPVLESFGDAPAREMASFDHIFGLTRYWFETTDGNGLIQVQKDRLLHNWRKEKDTDHYPHYDYVIGKFRSCLEVFEGFLDEKNLGKLELTQFELTYVNHIPSGEGWETFDDLGNVFRDFFRRGDKARFLPHPEAISWQTSFRLPEQTGRLHVSTRLGKRKKDEVPVILLELTARGVSPDDKRVSMWTWFDMAHEWIVCGFADLTAEAIQKNVWRRKR